MSQALRIADELIALHGSTDIDERAAAELRRLHEANQTMRNALLTIANIALMDKGHWAKTIEAEAIAAINTTEEQSK